MKQQNQNTIITSNSIGLSGDNYNEKSLLNMLAYLEKAEEFYFKTKLKNTKNMINKMVKK